MAQIRIKRSFTSSAKVAGANTTLLVGELGLNNTTIWYGPIRTEADQTKTETVEAMSLAAHQNKNTFEQQTTFRKGVDPEVKYAAIFEDDIDAQGNAFFRGKEHTVTIEGNLEVQGTTTTVGTQDLTVKDNIITLNKGAKAATSPVQSGLHIEGANSSTGANDGYLLYNSTTHKWSIGTGAPSGESGAPGEAVQLHELIDATRYAKRAGSVGNNAEAEVGLVRIGTNLNIDEASGLLSAAVEPGASYIRQFAEGDWKATSASADTALGAYKWSLDFQTEGIQYTTTGYTVSVVCSDGIESGKYIESPCTVVKNVKGRTLDLYAENAFNGYVTLTSGGKFGEEKLQLGHNINDNNAATDLTFRPRMTFMRGLQATDVAGDPGYTKISLLAATTTYLGGIKPNKTAKVGGGSTDTYVSSTGALDVAIDCGEWLEPN